MKKEKVLKHITLYLAANIEPFSQTKFNKLIFFLDAFAYSHSGQQTSFTGLTHRKIPYGTVIDGALDLLNKMHYKNDILFMPSLSQLAAFSFIVVHPDKHKTDLSLDTLFPTNKKLKTALERIVKIFKHVPSHKLADFTMNLTAWKKSKYEIPVNMTSLKNDIELKKKYGEGNFSKLILKKS